MTVRHFLSATLLASSGLAIAAPAFAQGDEETHHTVTVMATNQDLSKGFGSQQTVRLDYALDVGDTTVVFTAEEGRRKVAGTNNDSFGFGAQIYAEIAPGVTSHSSVQVAENEPVFPKLDLTQDFTFKVADKTTATVGVRYAQYFGDKEVTFMSGGVRQYFGWGSVGYKLTYVKPQGQSGFTAHLANLTIKDGHGKGKTQLWLSAGGTAVDNSLLNGNFSGSDYGATIERLQPIGEKVSLKLTAGINSYDRPAGRVTGKSVGVGLVFNIK